MSIGIEGFIFYSGPGGMGWGDVSGVRVGVRDPGWGQGSGVRVGVGLELGLGVGGWGWGEG